LAQGEVSDGTLTSSLFIRSTFSSRKGIKHNIKHTAANVMEYEGQLIHIPQPVCSDANSSVVPRI